MSLFLLLSFLLLAATSLHAEPFSTSFRVNEVPSNASLLGTAAVNAETLKLTTRPSGLPPFPARVGSFVVNDLAGGGAVSAFTVTFNALISGGPGEGISFCWGTGLPLSGTAFGEEGPSGFQGLVVSFDTTDSDGDGPDAVGIELRWQGALLVERAVSAAILRRNTFVPVTIRLIRHEHSFFGYLVGYVVQVNWDGEYYINANLDDAIALPNFIPVAGARFGWGARNRSGSVPQDNHWIDDIAITFPLPAASIIFDDPLATSTTATLRGRVTSIFSAATWFFEYGETAAYGAQTPVQNLLGSPVSALISGLTAGTTYHYRLVASNAGGTSQTADRTFTPIFDEAPAALPTAPIDPPLAWADYDNDGDLDLALAAYSDSGSALVQIHRNQGGGVFTDIQAELPRLDGCVAVWGDYDNDGDLDLALAGNDGATRLVQIRRNNGGGIFTDIQAGLPGVSSGSLAWGDYDNDGDLDLALCGQVSNSTYDRRTQIYRNDGDGVFTDIQAGLPGVRGGYLAWGDYDNDGDLDLALCGTFFTSVITQIYRNDGEATFTDIQVDLPAVTFLAWGDYDNDGDLDLAVSAYGNVLRNDGGGVFTDIQSHLRSGSHRWGDYDNDGDLDWATAAGGGTHIGRNDGSGVFTAIDPAIPGRHSLAWGDYDNDGDLDLATADSLGPTQIQTNKLLAPNTPPATPTQLAASITALQISFSWAAPVDDHTPSSALTYNLRVGSAPGLSDVLAAPADPVTGMSRLPQMGAQQTGTTARLTLPGGRYYWSVQAVDGAFAGGPWAQEQAFFHPTAPTAVTEGVTAITESGATFSALINLGGRDTTGLFDFGVTTTYGSSTPSVSLGNGFVALPHSAVVNGLAADSVYQFRARASNVLGEGVGANLSFRTLAFTAGPNPLTASLAPDASVLLPVTLTNHTAAALTVAINFQAPAPGWAVVPASRNVPANGNATVNVFFDATGLSASSQQTATLHFDAGSGRVPIDVPVTLNVTAPAFEREEFLPGGGGVRLTWNWPGGQTFPVEVSDNLVDWSTLGTTVGTSPGVFAITDPQAAGKTRRFYRPVLSP